MDSHDRDESKVRRREETLARRVGEALDQINPRRAGECPDAEVIAAYAEQALGPAESAQWDGHFAVCARCRKIVRVLAASADTPLADKEVAQLGQLVSAARSPVEINGSLAVRARPALKHWRTRWLAPALGAAAALAVWFALHPHRSATDRDASTTLIAQAPKEELPSSPAPTGMDRLSRVAPQQDHRKEAVPPPNEPAANTQPLNSPMQLPAKDRADAENGIGGISQGVREEADSLQEKQKLNSPPDRRGVQPAVIPPLPPPSPTAQAVTGAPAAPQSESKAVVGTAAAEAPQLKAMAGATGGTPSRDKDEAEVEQAADATTSGAVGKKASPELRSSGRKDQPFAVLRPAPSYSSLLKAPSGSVLWRAGKDGMIERSTDAGQTWASQLTPSREDWLAGAAVSDTVCWLVGRNGAIARTTDGEHWVRVAVPAQFSGDDSKLPDWAGIATSDVQSATITATDGRKFATTDGGNTWQVQ